MVLFIITGGEWRLKFIKGKWCLKGVRLENFWLGVLRGKGRRLRRLRVLKGSRFWSLGRFSGSFNSSLALTTLF